MQESLTFKIKMLLPKALFSQGNEMEYINILMSFNMSIPCLSYKPNYSIIPYHNWTMSLSLKMQAAFDLLRGYIGEVIMCPNDSVHGVIMMAPQSPLSKRLMLSTFH